MSIKHALAAVLALAAWSTARAAEPGTTLSGKVFLDYTYRDNHDDATSRAADKNNGTAFDLKRFYLTVDHTFDDVWAARFRTDVGNETNGKYDVFVKNAYVQGTVAKELVVRAGAADMPWFPFLEDLYGYRYVENVLDDRLKLGNSADWGVHFGGKVADGLFSYALSVVNGRGYSDPTRTKTPTVEGRVSVNPLKELTIGVAGSTGYLGQNVVGTLTPNKATRYDGVIAWVSGPLRLGVSGMVAENYSVAIVTKTPATTKTDKAIGYSGWASYAFDPVSLFVRADYVQPNKDTNSSLKDTYVNGGVAYKFAKPFDLALVYKSEQVKSGKVVTSNGTIGSATAKKNGSLNEVGLFGQYVF